jgi:hypothetical protein
MALSFARQQSGDTRQPEEAIAPAVKTWLRERRGDPASRGLNGKNCSCRTARNGSTDFW